MSTNLALTYINESIVTKVQEETYLQKVAKEELKAPVFYQAFFRMNLILLTLSQSKKNKV